MHIGHMHAHFGDLQSRILLYYYCALSLWPLETLAHSVCTACIIGPAQTPPLPLPIASPTANDTLRPSPAFRRPLLDVEHDGAARSGPAAPYGCCTTPGLHLDVVVRRIIVSAAGQLSAIYMRGAEGLRAHWGIAQVMLCNCAACAHACAKRVMFMHG